MAGGASSIINGILSASDAELGECSPIASLSELNTDGGGCAGADFRRAVAFVDEAVGFVIGRGGLKAGALRLVGTAEDLSGTTIVLKYDERWQARSG